MKSNLVRSVRNSFFLAVAAGLLLMQGIAEFLKLILNKDVASDGS